MESTSISPKHAALQCHQDDQALIRAAVTGGPRTLRNCAERRSSPTADGGTKQKSGEMDQMVAVMQGLSILR
ncbi:unnamed protein product [Macrosiphum euphorbiae]|uniref:FHA domain-containing protein n=1 Tax=Macrosiphum euphorbiae TaxID=13131 RepID=A0AAV0XIZ2_9HEMI|nr:unnamed protein product [Macrosiphum euphorbiae]